MRPSFKGAIAREAVLLGEKAPLEQQHVLPIRELFAGEGVPREAQRMLISEALGEGEDAAVAEGCVAPPGSAIGIVERRGLEEALLGPVLEGVVEPRPALVREPVAIGQLDEGGVFREALTALVGADVRQGPTPIGGSSKSVRQA
jgi:hypothetical protein